MVLAVCYCMHFKNVASWLQWCTNFSFGENFPLLFMSSWDEIKNTTKSFDKLPPLGSHYSLHAYCMYMIFNFFFIASTCGLTKPQMVWNLWHVWTKYRCGKALARKVGAVQKNKNSRLQKADLINQRFHRWSLLGCWSKKSSWGNLAVP